MTEDSPELITDCGCKTCDHKIAETMQEVVDCEHSLLRDMDDAKFYISVPKEDLEELIDQWRSYSGFLQREVGKNQCAQDLAGIIRDG